MLKPPAIDGLVARLGRWSAGRGPLYVLLAARLRELIDDGELPPDTPLPPDRAFATALAVGRGTVVAAYDVLCQEGKIVRRQGSGTRVASAVLPRDRTRAGDTANPLFLHLLERPDHVVQLTCATPTTVPPEVTSAYTRALSLIRSDGLGYHPAGHPALRGALAERYTRRGLPTEPDQILVTTGAQQALSLVTRLLVRPGDKVVVEAPTYPGALEVFREAAAIPRPVSSVDGLDWPALVDVLGRERPALGYLIPTHHNPTGTVLPTPARRRVAEVAAVHGVPLVDDEALVDLGFDGAEPAPLAVFAPDNAVLTVGSLSKIVWGGLRVGWVRASAALVARLARLKAVHDLGSDVASQLAAVDLLADLDAIRARRAGELRRRHDRLRAELGARLPDWRFRPAAGGQTLWVRLPHGDAVSFAQLALRHGIALLPGGSLDVSGGSAACLRIPFLAPPDELGKAVRQLAGAWRDYSPSADPPTTLAPLAI
ncbi:aminotransferase-like domain-containing protein [Streptoalloteichus hindustanus]|uniref:DNA-binding transcriptional regulator, MocR family, contains an aminotransferase domain n=1 Tax=Streptoalloteichus hindustanus TaxID=2017 RepID=A0A1M4ZEU9_STRHI|nr:PLP-dependent aminotransferase family protein [Streptoalloteichus hindustanus]SHF16126.1 DNA-binding transcriptional regulator, MocR family, contains an aminotransferase domain [Streptoalloteichus hindustanus]